MTSREQDALDHAYEELRYQASPQAAEDRSTDALRRAQRDKAAGHTPRCSLTRCAPDCPKSLALKVAKGLNTGR
jgi:hypothetical protein